MWRFALTIFLGAFLLFLVQPMIGKFILPWFGGGSGVWTACLLFFQTLLLGGYAYAHGLVRWIPQRAQAWVHIALLAAGFLFLPVMPDAAWKPTGNEQPVWWIILLLSACIGLPYLALSATGPLMQAWFARAAPGRSPYRLYALSNAGSLLALFAYPFVMEPWLPRPAQSWLWSGGFVLFAILFAWCALRAQTRKPTQVAVDQQLATNELVKRPAPAQQRSPTPLNYLLWILLPACASMMLVAATSQISEEIAPAPFLWVLPLSVYLLTFILAFDRPRWYVRSIFGWLVLAAPWLYLLLLLLPAVVKQLGLDVEPDIGAHVLLYLLVMFICCMVCHGELYRLRPSPEKLTLYYLALAAGGALGSAFVSLAAPLLFTYNLEWYFGMFGTMGLMLVCLFRDPGSFCFRGAKRPAWLALIMLALLAAVMLQMTVATRHQNDVLRARNFYGTLAVRLEQTNVEGVELLKLDHGRIAHGAQVLHPDYRRWPSAYYAPTTGVGMALRHYRQGEQPIRMGVVGLGVGTMAAYGVPGDVFRFYELNPQVWRYAQDPFTYLSDSSADIEVILGDARLSLEREEPNNFDILVLDAFSGDAIPLHLLTREAFEVYRRHMKPEGVIAVHVSNNYLDLHPIVHRAAREFGLAAVSIMTDKDRNNLVLAADWVLITRNQGLFDVDEIKFAAKIPLHLESIRLWTDDYCSLLQVLR